MNHIAVAFDVMIGGRGNTAAADADATRVPLNLSRSYTHTRYYMCGVALRNSAGK